MSSPRSRWILLVSLAAGCFGLVWWNHGTRGKPASLPPSGGVVARPPVSAPPLDKSSPSVSGSLNARLPPASTPQTLEDLRNWVESLPADEAVARIRSFLENGGDKNTGLSFEIKADGSLKEWPTFRTYLIDALLAIDPAAAAQISRGILSSPTTADEWALALRNVGRAEDADQSRDFLREKTVELIRNPDWQANPSIGYLNTFDILVHTGATIETPLLSKLIQNKERRDLAHAAFLTVDRLVQQAPADMLENLAADTALQQSRPEMTAQQFARADLRDDRQRELVQQWLLAPERTTTELNAFAGVYPNSNRFVSNNLLTHEAPQTGADLAAHDREVLRILNTWREDPEFEPILEHLSAMSFRLEKFTRVSPTTEP